MRSYRILLVIPLLLLVAALDGIQEHAQDDTPFLRWPRLVQALLLAVSALLILLITPAHTGEPFVYQGF